jgi:hypothetical protein
MDIDERFPMKLPSVQDAPEPFRSALADNISSQESVRLLIHAPVFSTLEEKTKSFFRVIAKEQCPRRWNRCSSTRHRS